MEKNIFQKIIDREVPAEIIEETEKLIVIKDISPQAPIHLLIIPKKKFENISKIEKNDEDYGKEIFLMAKYLSEKLTNAKEFKLLINNGYKAGQRVFHLHAHFMSGYN